jgi:hypothetical protein
MAGSNAGQNTTWMHITYMHTCIHAYMHTCIHAYMHTCIHAYMHTSIHAYIHTCIHAYIHTCIHATADVRILNGGFKRWSKIEDRETSTSTDCMLKLYSEFHAHDAYPSVSTFFFCAHTYTHTHIYSFDPFVSMYFVCARARARAHTHTHTRMYTHKCVDACMHIRTHT